MSESSDNEPGLHGGGCHCGRVRFQVRALTPLVLDECNCSICAKTGYLHLLVPRESFRLLSGQDDLTEYRFNTGAARHLFCSTCGVKSFYVPRSHPDGISVNARCLDADLIADASVRGFDGRRWEEEIGALVERTPGV